MKRLFAGTLVVAMLTVAFLGLMRTVRAEDRPPPEKDLLKQVQGDLEAVKADLAGWAAKHEALGKEFDKLKTSFDRHSHPVKFWDSGKKRASGWKERGAFFIAYPKVGAGDKDEDAAKAGGTWGTP